MHRHRAAVAYRWRLRHEVSDHLASLDVDLLTLIELGDLLAMLQAIERGARLRHRSSG